MLPRSSVALGKAATETVGCSFDISPAHKQLRDRVRQFTKDEIIPVTEEHDRTMEFPATIFRRAHREHLLNTSITSRHGDAPRDKLAQAIISEEIGYGCTGVGLAMFINELSMTPLLLAGDSYQQETFLRPMAEEPIMAAYCVTESSAGSDVAAIRTRAVRSGDEYVINGAKAWISNGGKAAWYFVLARTDMDPSAPAGRAFTAFAVPAKTQGIEPGKKEHNMGQRCSDTRMISFDDVRVPEAFRIGEEGEGFKIVMRTFDATRPLVSSMATGLLSRCLDETINFLRDRKQSDGVVDQITQFKLAEMAMNVEMSRLMCYKSAAMIDAGSSSAYHSSLAKTFAAEKANEAAAAAVEIFGHAGCTQGCPVEKLLRDAKIFQIYGGTTQIQQLIISRLLLR
ncbi:hypothetical protein PFISCL1PPCAC_13023 [Pristionchus fissidentatus]|uniref:Medium-chain specific acyl-CoA dehydrogenase, mitochondrial n=1 Tax=Pristionchus fissidentatus TaxID=1538716 RepID=A0AAV5VT46_9BILA|nr:hypothetical protein PFISCL1PPCAC_13023 [Pristionchus fissidentatus]